MGSVMGPLYEGSYCLESILGAPDFWKLNDTGNHLGLYVRQMAILKTFPIS